MGILLNTFTCSFCKYIDMYTVYSTALLHSQASSFWKLTRFLRFNIKASVKHGKPWEKTSCKLAKKDISIKIFSERNAHTSSYRHWKKNREFRCACWVSKVFFFLCLSSKYNEELIFPMWIFISICFFIHLDHASNKSLQQSCTCSHEKLIEFERRWKKIRKKLCIRYFFFLSVRTENKYEIDVIFFLSVREKEKKYSNQ